MLVADGWAARHYEALGLRESEEMREDRAYLERLVARLHAEGFRARAGRVHDSAEGFRARAEPVHSCAERLH